MTSPTDPNPFGPDSDISARLQRALGTQYQVRSLLGRGGFAEVFEVWDTSLDRRLAVKVLRPDIAWTSGMLARFKQETRTIAKLNHPNILPIHFVGEGEGLVYYAMPFIEGESLGELLRRRGALDAEQTLKIAIPILDALQHAHERGLIHRDIKPDNVMIDAESGRPLLVDFGIAKQLGGDKGLTQTGFVVGTPHYMSPEQALGQGDLDSRSDLYAMGAVLFQMVTGQPPFDGDTSQEIVGKHIADPPPVASMLDPRVPQWLSGVIVRAMQKKPAERFQSAAMMLQALSDRKAPSVPSAAAKTTPMPAASEAATEIVPSGQRRASKPAAPAAARAASAPKRRHWLGWVVAAVVVIAGGLIAATALTRPVLAFRNDLIQPIRVTAPDGRQRVLKPGETVTVKLRRGHAVAFHWSLIRPNNERGEPMGQEMDGTVNIDRPSGKMARAAEAVSTNGTYFAPLITNDTPRFLDVVVNAGFTEATPCNCRVPPGAAHFAIGYYKLFSNSSVKAELLGGRSAEFTDLGPQVSKTDGVVGLRFDVGNFRR